MENEKNIPKQIGDPNEEKSERIISNPTVLSDDTLIIIISYLDIISLINFSETSYYLRILTIKFFDKLKISKVKNFLYLFNDSFQKPLPLEDPIFTTALLSVYQKLNDPNLKSSRSSIEAAIKDLSEQCNVFLDEKKVAAYKELFNQKINDEPYEDNPLHKKIVTTTFAAIAEKPGNELSKEDQQKQIQEIITVIKLHFLSSLYALNNQLLDAWYTAFIASQNKVCGGHLAAAAASIYYLSCLAGPNYSIAPKILFCHSKLQNFNAPQILQWELRDKLVSSLLEEWIKDSGILPNTSPLGYRVTLQIKFFELNKTNKFYKSISNLLTNFPAAYKKYGQALFDNLHGIMPYLTDYRNIIPLVEQLTIVELLNIDRKLIDILHRCFPIKAIGYYLDFIKDKYSSTTLTKLLNCAYPEIFFRIGYKNLPEWDKAKNSQQPTLLEGLIFYSNKIYQAHYQYLHDKVNPDLHAIYLKWDKDWDVISQQYAAMVIYFILKQRSLPAAPTTINNLITYSFRCAQYIVSLKLPTNQISQLNKCNNLFQQFSGHLDAAQSDQFKPELEALYALHTKTPSEVAKKFSQDHIESLPSEQILTLIKLINDYTNTYNEEVTSLFYIFEKKLSEVFLDLQQKKWTKQLSLTFYLALYESKTAEQFSYLDVYKNLTEYVLQTVLVAYPKRLTLLHECIMHPIIKKINSLEHPMQYTWLDLHYGLNHRRKNISPGSSEIDFMVYLNFLKHLDSIELSNYQKFSKKPISVFDYLTSISDTNTINQFSLYITDLMFEDFYFSEKKIQRFLHINNELLNQLSFAQVKELYATFDYLFEKFDYSCDDLADIKINLQFISKYINKWGFELLLQMAQEYYHQNPETEPSELYEFLSAMYQRKEVTSIPFQFFVPATTNSREQSQITEVAEIEITENNQQPNT